MLKKIIVIAICIVSIIFVYSKNTKENEVEKQKVNDSQAQRDNSNKPENSLKYLIYKLNSDEKIILIDNFQDKKSSEVIFKEYNCNALINAGFYTQDNKPLGLFIVKNKKIENKKTSSLFNGFVNIDNPQDIIILDEINSQNIFQTGPILVKDGDIVNLKLKNDENARRSVLIQDTNNNIYFIILYDKSSFIKGPLLVNLARELEKISKENNFSIKNAINLDGGTASAFITATNKIKELSNVGSFVCSIN